MATSLKDVTLSDSRLQEILNVASDWALGNGVSTTAKDEKGLTIAYPAPYSLFPSVVPKEVLNVGKSTMVHFSRLMHKVAMDHEFMEDALKNVIEVDSFMQNLWNIYLQVRKSSKAQTLHLGLFRNDFMMNTLDSVSPGDLVAADRLELKQIEFNSIASSFGGLTQKIGDLHRLTLSLAGKSFESSNTPENKPATGLAGGMVKAWELYGNPKAIIVFIVSATELNVMDQRWLEFKVYEHNPKIRVLRKTLLDFQASGILDVENRLTINGDEVAVVYYRDGYTIGNYPTQKEWDGRLKLELSQAIKCPSVQYQLMGAKKIQQVLAKPGALERFISDPEVVKSLRATFANQYSLDLGEEGDTAVKLALEAPHLFVLKPQREGGGNNLYGDDITKFLNEYRNSKERNAYILMQRIFPWQQQNYLVKKGVPFSLNDVISEIGIYGVFIGSPDEEITNYECGHMMRTKVQGTDEGGIVAGFAVLDTPFIV